MEESIEGEELQVTYVCNICNKAFGWKGNLNRHMKEVHHGGEKVICDVCDKDVLKRYFHMHLKGQHGITRKKEPNAKSGIACPSCSDKFLNLDDLRRHAWEDHGVKQEVELLTFRDEAEFSAWKRALEKENNSSFVVKHGKAESVGAKKQTYHCNRSGTYKHTGKNLRALKSQGTCKLGAYCTASINAVFRKTEVQVSYHKTHFGHELDVSDLLHVRIPETDKQLIAGRLMEGATMEDVLEELREGDTVERKALVDKKDLRNIICKFGLDKRHCELCGFTCPDLASLRRHMTETHAYHQDLWCTQCRFKGISRLALQKHRLKQHPRLYERTKCMEMVVTNGVESPCAASFAFFSRLRYHLAQAHGISAAIEKETILCGSASEFHSWMLGYETGTISQYSTRNRRLVTGKPARYRCARSGVYKPAGRGIRRIKSQGSRKIGRDCTSEIRAELLEDGTVRVTVFPYHYGHETGAENAPHTTVPASERDVAKEKLLHGVSRRRIIEEMRGSLQAAGEGGAILAEKINKRSILNMELSLRSGTGDVVQSVNVDEDGDQRFCVMDVDDSTGAIVGDDHQGGCWLDTESAQSPPSGGDAQSVPKVASIRQPRMSSAPTTSASSATPDETTAELHRLRAEVAQLRSTLRKTTAAHDVERAKLLSVFTPRQADILLGRRARSDDWSGEDLRRAIALRRVLTRRQYEHLRLHLWLPLPEISQAAALGQTSWEKRRLYLRLLYQRLAVDNEQPSDRGDDTMQHMRLCVLRSSPERRLPTEIFELKEEVVEDDPDPVETHEEAAALRALCTQTLDETGVGVAEDRFDGDAVPKPARSRRLKVVVTPGPNQKSHVYPAGNGSDSAVL